MKKRLVCVGLVAVFAASALAFAGCGGEGEKAELEKQLSAAQSVVQRQETEISELEKLKAELQEQIDGVNARVDELEEKIKNLESDRSAFGVFYSLEEAYKSGFLTKENLQYISEHAYEQDFFETLEKETELKIKKDYCMIKRLDLKLMDSEQYVLEPYGVYDGNYVVRLFYGMYHDVEINLLVDGVEFTYTGPEYLVWKSF